jgi:hypothetical protein
MKRNSLFLILLLAGSTALVVNCTSSGESKTEPVSEDEEMTASGGDHDSSCLQAPDFWFPHSQTPDPEEGAKSPFAYDETTNNCDFHHWSWQKFLFLTKPGKNGRAAFESLVQIDNELNRLDSSTGIILKDTTQAGNTAGTLYDRKNKPVLYAIFMNKQMYSFCQEYLTNFLSVGINNLASKGYDTLTYPVGCLELKTSWMLTSSMDPSDLRNYYITKAHIGSSTGPLVSVALLGIHVVGRVANHPEFIWATFDHSMLAPTYDFSNSAGTDQVLSNQNYAFYDAGKKASECRMNFGTAQKFGFKSIYQVYALGMAQSATDKSLPTSADRNNNRHIMSLNKSVKDKLSQEKGPWMNYAYTGSIWIDPTVQKLKPNDKQMGKLTNANLRGSRALGNLTMETFEQPDAAISKTSGSNNCFLCHTTQDDESGNPKIGYNLAVSHVFTNAFYVRRNPKAAGSFK